MSLDDEVVIEERGDLMSKPSGTAFVSGCDPKYMVGIHFNLNDTKVNIEKLFQVQSLLNEMGISFDTGAGGGQRDWFFDFSLQGPISVTIKPK
jgi:hypothetical protein